MGFLKRLFGSTPAGQGGDGEADDGADAAPGWDAMDATLGAIYGTQEPTHWGTVVSWRLGGPDPLDGVSAYRNPGPPAHWHFVTYGLSELYVKESEIPELSGWGFELTFRLRRDEADTEAPLWAASLLQNLARYVVESGNPFGHGHHIDAHGPIALETDTALVAVAFAADPQLGQIDTMNGSLEFLQVFGLTRDEYDAIKPWDTSAFLDLVRRDNSLLVTDLGRGSLLSDPALAAEVAARTAEDGSSMSGFFVDEVSWSTEDGVVLTFGATAVEDIRILLVGRVALGREAVIQGPESAVDVTPGSELAWSADDATLRLAVPAELARSLAGELRPVAGDYGAGSLRVRIVRSIIRDQDGNEVRTVG